MLSLLNGEGSGCNVFTECLRRDKDATMYTKNRYKPVSTLRGRGGNTRHRRTKVTSLEEGARTRRTAKMTLVKNSEQWVEERSCGSCTKVGAERQLDAGGSDDSFSREGF